MTSQERIARAEKNSIVRHHQSYQIAYRIECWSNGAQKHFDKEGHHFMTLGVGRDWYYEKEPKLEEVFILVDGKYCHELGKS